MSNALSARPGLLAVLSGVLVLTMLQLPLADASEHQLEATIRTTTYGIPHILADDWEDLAFGYGYAFARDNICTAADFYVTVNAERSRYFGPDGTWNFRGNGTVNTNLDSDFFYARINGSGIVEDLVSQDPPHGPSDAIRAGVRGYAAGYNHWLRETGVDGISDPRCAGEPWVREIDEMDVYRRFYQLASLASTGVAINEIGSAQPPTPALPSDGGSDGDAGTAPTQEQLDLVDEIPDRMAEVLGIGSNAYGLGSDVTDNGRGMLLGNPHFPWYGGERLYQSHLTIPGRADVAGASLYGVPLILIGHTEGVAWSHTVSTAYRFTPFELTLVPGSPTTYLVDGEPREMARDDLTVEVRREDGSIEEESRTLYTTEYGPVMSGILGLPIFPWTPARAWAMGDVNETNFRYLNHFFEKNRAQSVREVFDIQRDYLGIPWVNTVAADRDGEAYYGDVSAVPNVPDSKAQECNTPLGQATFAALRLPVLDGARSACDWDDDDDAVAPGIFGPSNLPHLFRDDHVSNMNDSHWLTNLDEPLTGFAQIIGDEETERTLRTRLGIRIILDRLGGDDEYEDTGTWSHARLVDAVFNNRQHAAELTRDDLVDMCETFPDGVAPSSSGPIDVSGACPVLAEWDLRDDLDAAGALLFRRFWTHASGAAPSPWLEPFDAEDPVNTPNTLNVAHPQVQAALGDAVNDLESVGIPLDAGLRGHQWSSRGEERIPTHGGPGGLGVFNAINVVWDGEEYHDTPHGSSFVMVVQFTDGCPEVSTIVTYSQSEDVTSPHFDDQTRAFSEKTWNDVPFCEEDIAADPNLTVEVVRGDPLGAPDDEPPPAAHAPSLPATGGGAALPVLALFAALALAASRRWRAQPGRGTGRGR